MLEAETTGDGEVSLVTFESTADGVIDVTGVLELFKTDAPATA
jgi:hypothetical protein